jgi:integral membrane protein
VHGYLYLVYVVVAVDLWFRTRLPIGRTVLVVLAGTIPFMSFVMERRVSADEQPAVR